MAKEIVLCCGRGKCPKVQLPETKDGSLDDDAIVRIKFEKIEIEQKDGKVVLVGTMTWAQFIKMCNMKW